LTRLAASLALALVVAGRAAGQDTAGDSAAGDPSELIDTLLSGFLGFRDMTGEELQKEVADIGDVPFRSPVPLDYLDRTQLARYLAEVFDAEYPRGQADADARTLTAFGLLDPGTDLRGLRQKILEENIAGFYDDRPGRKRLYAVSAKRTLTPANQIILSHELRHALQDQYMNTHSLLDDSIGDYDDRRLALLCLLEGDATFLMERFLLKRVPGGEEAGGALNGSIPLPAPPVEGAPPVVRDQLVLPYTTGSEFVRAVWERGGWAAVRRAWDRPPASTEEVLHPSKYFADEQPRLVGVGYAPPGRSKVVSQGVLGEMLVRTLLGEGAADAASGWGGDAFRVWDVGGRTLLVWRAEWDTPSGGAAFGQALRARLASVHGASRGREAFDVFGRGPWKFAVAGNGSATLLVSSDDESALSAALASLRLP
jgi:hypothetical protein